MSLCCECCVLSGRGLCGGLITRPDGSYWLWRVVVCDLETSWMRRPWPTGRLLHQKKERNKKERKKKVLTEMSKMLRDNTSPNTNLPRRSWCSYLTAYYSSADKVMLFIQRVFLRSLYQPKMYFLNYNSWQLSKSYIFRHLDQRVGLEILCSRRFPEDGATVSKHVAVGHLSWIVFYTVDLLVDILIITLRRLVCVTYLYFFVCCDCPCRL